MTQGPSPHWGTTPRHPLLTSHASWVRNVTALYPLHARHASPICVLHVVHRENGHHTRSSSTVMSRGSYDARYAGTASDSLVRILPWSHDDITGMSV